jgi:uncharacterized YigZ family protein
MVIVYFCCQLQMKPENKEYYNTIETASIAEFKDRGSKFIGTVFPIKTIEDFKIEIKKIKALHPKANHHCFAYRLGLDGTVFRVSDDGEPSGSAGKPILNQIDSKELTNVAAVVTRYFGGTLLGVPGLIEAYKTATTFALQTTPIIKKQVIVVYNLQFDYTITNTVMTLLKQLQVDIILQEIQLFCQVKIGIAKTKEAEALHKFKEIYSLTCTKV